jgi:hypothetical protein
MLNRAKKKEATELIRLMIFQAEDWLCVFYACLTQKTAFHIEEPNLYKASFILHQYISNADEVLGPFCDTFSDQEMHTLIRYYQTEAMKKLCKNRKKLFEPLYLGCKYALNQIFEKTK